MTVFLKGQFSHRSKKYFIVAFFFESTNIYWIPPHVGFCAVDDKAFALDQSQQCGKQIHKLARINQ